MVEDYSDNRIFNIFEDKKTSVISRDILPAFDQPDDPNQQEQLTERGDDSPKFISNKMPTYSDNKKQQHLLAKLGINKDKSK